MSKRLYCVFCFLLLGVVRFVFCKNDLAEAIRKRDLKWHQESLDNFNVDYCMDSINEAIREYQSHDINHLGVDQYDILLAFRHNASTQISVDYSALLTTYGGHIIFCNSDIAEPITRISRQVAGVPNPEEHVRCIRHENRDENAVEESHLQVCEDELKKRQEKLDNFNLQRCLNSILDVLDFYEAFINDVADSPIYYDIVDVYNAAEQRKRVHNSALMSAKSGHVIFCDCDISVKIIEITRKLPEVRFSRINETTFVPDESDTE